MKAISLGAIFVPVLIWVSQASAQSVGDLPFSVGAIGMGGVSASVPSDNAMALSSNPAQAGLFTYIVDHIDLEYDYSRVNYSKSVSQSFYELSLVIS